MLVRSLHRLVGSHINSRPLAVARIGVGVAVVFKAIERTPVLERLSDPGAIHVPYLVGQPTLLELPPGLVVTAWVMLGVTFTLGAATVPVGILLTALMSAVLLSDQQLYSNHLYLLIWLIALLTLARSGAALSVDALRAGEIERVPAWPVALIKLQIVVVYFWAGISKVNLEYLSGSVVASSLRPDGFLAVPDSWHSFELMATASIVSIVAETGLALGLVIRRWRRTAFVVGLGVHVFIAFWLTPTLPLVIFGLMMLAPFVLFLPPRRRRLTVVWDDSCGFCARWVRLFRTLDWLAALDFVPSSDDRALRAVSVDRGDADRALQFVADGHRSEGFRAVVDVLEALPPSFLWAPVLRLGPIQWAGDLVYRRVAARRSCRIAPAAS